MRLKTLSKTIKWKYNVIYSCFWMLLLVKSVVCTENITDIKVTPILKSKNHGNYIQMQIDWESTLPNNNTKYDIIIKAISDVTVKPHCENDICAEYSHNSTQIILPEFPEIKEHAECRLRLGCDYNVFIETSNKEYGSSLNYTVDDCVNGICSCYYEFYIPRVDKFSAEFNTLTMDLITDFSYDNILNYHSAPISGDVYLNAIRLRLLRPVQNTHLSWGGRQQLIFDKTVSLKSNKLTTKKVIKEQISIKLDEKTSLKKGVNYTLRATLVDNRNCESRIKDTVVYLPLEVEIQGNQNETREFWWLLIVVTSSFFIVIILTVICVFCVNKYRKSSKIINNWRGVYKNVPSSIGTSINIPMHDNVLYIEKEILDAKARGELDILEIPHSAIKIGKEIGKGAFGRVFCATAAGIYGRKGPSIVAVKQLKRRPTTEELEEFLGEMYTLRKVGQHPNVVSLLGFCTVKQPLMMVMEYVGCGDLLGYLRKIRDKRVQSQSFQNLDSEFKLRESFSNNNIRQNLSSNSNSRNSYSHNTNCNHEGRQRCHYPDMFYLSSTSSDATSSYANQADTVILKNPSTNAETMTTLLGSDLESSLFHSSEHCRLDYILDHNELHNFALQIARGMCHLEENKITHRDLAARNILIDENKILKISDFGLSRTGIYINTKNKRVPLRWLSIEAIKDNLYSSKSDVWAYGIVLWEIGTLGGFPYPTICNTDILEFLTSGQRLERPENCTKQLYELMLHCWAANPNDRPSFQQIHDQLDPQKQPIYIDFNELDPNYAFPPTIDELGLNVNNKKIDNKLDKTLSSTLLK